MKKNFNKRLIFKMINIKSQIKGINLQTGMNSFDHAYISCLSNI